MRSLGRKLTYNYRERGINGLVCGAVRFFRRSLWSEYQWMIYEHTLREFVVEDRAMLKRRELGFEELIRLNYVKALELPDGIRRRFAERNICYGFFEGEELATIGWSSPGCLELDTDLRIPCPGAVGLFDFHTVKAFRSRGCYTAALQQLVVIAQQSNFTKAYIAVDSSNIPSIRGIERAGFCRAKLVTRRQRFCLREIVEEKVK